MDLKHPFFTNCNEEAKETGKTEGSTSNNEEESKSYWMLFVLGLVGGLVSLITPCVFPDDSSNRKFLYKGRV